jgi:hypothetical protein
MLDFASKNALAYNSAGVVVVNYQELGMEKKHVL